MSDHVLFGVFPYIAGASLVLVTLLRLSLLRERERGAGRAGASFLPRRPRTVGGWLCACGLIGLAVGHVLLLAFPDAVRAWTEVSSGLMIFEGVMFALGVLTLLGLLALTRVLLRDTVAGRTAMRLADVALIGVLLVAVVSGLVMAAKYRWASSWSLVTLTPYIHSVLRFDPRLDLLATQYLVKLHVFSSFAFVALLPFTSAIDLLLALGSRMLDIAFAPFRGRARQLHAWVDQRGRQLVWPEEED